MSVHRQSRHRQAQAAALRGGRDLSLPAVRTFSSLRCSLPRHSGSVVRNLDQGVSRSDAPH